MTTTAQKQSDPVQVASRQAKRCLSHLDKIHMSPARQRHVRALLKSSVLSNRQRGIFIFSVEAALTTLDHLQISGRVKGDLNLALRSHHRQSQATALRRVRRCRDQLRRSAYFVTPWTKSGSHPRPPYIPIVLF